MLNRQDEIGGSSSFISGSSELLMCSDSQAFNCDVFLKFFFKWFLRFFSSQFGDEKIQHERLHWIHRTSRCQRHVYVLSNALSPCVEFARYTPRGNSDKGAGKFQSARLVELYHSNCITDPAMCSRFCVQLEHPVASVHFFLLNL
jgi:hypothetical protein